jgi:hypothetical protein
MIVGAVVGVLLLACPTSGPKNAHLHWSDAATMVSPDCRWSVEVKPLPGDSDAAVLLTNVKTGAVRQLFVLARDGAVHWSADGQTLVVRYDEFSNHYRVMVFSPLDAWQTDTAALEVDRRIRADIEHTLAPTARILSYFPRFVSFTPGGAAIMSVGVVTVNGETGPTTRHCFGYVVTPSPLSIHARHEVSCQTDA